MIGKAFDTVAKVQVTNNEMSQLVSLITRRRRSGLDWIHGRLNTVLF